MAPSWDKLLIIILALPALACLIYYSIADHERQLKKAVHRRRMRGKLSVIEGGKLNDRPKKN